MGSPGLHTPAARLHSIFQVGNLVFIFTLFFPYLICPFLCIHLPYFPSCAVLVASELLSTLRTELNCKMGPGHGLCSQVEALNWLKATHITEFLPFQLLLLPLSTLLPSLCCRCYHLFIDCVYSQYIHLLPSITFPSLFWNAAPLDWHITNKYPFLPPAPKINLTIQHLPSAKLRSAGEKKITPGYMISA